MNARHGQWNGEIVQGLETHFLKVEKLSKFLLERRILMHAAKDARHELTVIHVRLARVYVENQWKSSALEWKNSYCVKLYPVFQLCCNHSSNNSFNRRINKII